MTTRTNQKRKKVKRLMNRDKKTEYNRWMPYICAILGIMVVSVAGVLVVRAYLTAVTNNKINPFAPMTYTNTEIDEPEDDFSSTQDSNKDITVAKSAKVKNLAGNDKKPVFIRVALTYSVYDDGGVNVTSDYPIQGYEFPNELGSDWTQLGDGYYYYNAIVPPGEETTEIFGTDAAHSIKVCLDKDLPSSYRIEVDVIADTVQAVAHDSSKWKASDYTADEVSKVWNYVPSFSVVGIEDTQQGVAITSWSSNTP